MKKDNHKKQEHEDVYIDIDEGESELLGSKNKLKKLREELKESNKKAQEYLTGWQKERADFVNYKSEEEKKRSERIKALKEDLLINFFPVLDSFDMAFHNKDSWEKVDKAWRIGVEYIYQQFMKVMEEYGVETIGTLGEEFNPLYHDPVEHIPVENESEDHTILTVIQKGYRSGDAVLRPAKVKVGNYLKEGK